MTPPFQAPLVTLRRKPAREKMRSLTGSSQLLLPARGGKDCGFLLTTSPLSP